MNEVNQMRKLMEAVDPSIIDEVIEEGLFSTIRDLASVASNQGINLDVNSNIKGAINDKSAIQKFMVMLTKNGFQSTERNTVWSKGAQRVLLGIDRQNKVYTVTVPSQG
jgi:phosphoribosyl-AMP cyclohydrolase